MLIPPDELYRLTADATARGFQVCVHAIGDRANTLVLDTLRARLRERPGRHARSDCAWSTRRSSPKEISTLRAAGRHAEHAGHALHSGHAVGGGATGGRTVWPAPTPALAPATGGCIAGGSDFPVEDPNPFHGIFAAVTRRPRHGEDPPWQPGSA